MRPKPLMATLTVMTNSYGERMTMSVGLALNSPETARIQPLICGLVPELQVFLQRDDFMDQENRRTPAVERDIAYDGSGDQPRQHQKTAIFHKGSPAQRLRFSCFPGKPYDIAPSSQAWCFAKPLGPPR
jgi:hypothetical protein